MSDENKKLIFIVAGAGMFVGSLLLVKWVRKRQEKEKEEPIADVTPKEDHGENSPTITAYHDKSSLDNGFKSEEKPKNYWEITAIAETEEKKPEETSSKSENEPEPACPYLITQDEYQSGKEGYQTIGLYCFADHFVTDANLKLVEDVDAIIGFESLTKFTPGSDSIYIRNDRLKCDYEVVQDERRYIDVAKKKSGDASGGID